MGPNFRSVPSCAAELPADHEPDPMTATQPVDLSDWFRPVADCEGPLTEPVETASLFAGTAQDEHPSGPLPQTGPWPPVAGVPESPAELSGSWLAQAYEVTLTGALGVVELGFRDGQWYSITDESARSITVGLALHAHPELSGQITQLICWWIRRHPMSERALDLATELAIGVTALSCV